MKLGLPSRHLASGSVLWITFWYIWGLAVQQTKIRKIDRYLCIIILDVNHIFNSSKDEGNSKYLSTSESLTSKTLAWDQFGFDPLSTKTVRTPYAKLGSTT